MADWQDRYFSSADGLRLHYRDYAGPADKPPILCLPGLTRNARDFEPVGDRFAGDWRVIALEFRGRGLSEYDGDPSRYTPAVYAADVLKLLDELGIADAVFFGTSLGGIVTMVLAAQAEERIAGALLNDIGPVLDPEGIARIGTYVGKQVRFADWDEAARAMAARIADIYPDFGHDDWLRFVHRTCAAAKDGSIQFDYDMAIADNFRAAEAAAPMDAWPYYEALAGRPVTILRGALSDLLDAPTALAMAARLDDVELVTVANVGHTPTFDEPASLDAADRLLARVERRVALERSPV